LREAALSREALAPWQDAAGRGNPMAGSRWIAGFLVMTKLAPSPQWPQRRSDRDGKKMDLCRPCLAVCKE
jgi:hypothetical protein